MNDSSSFFSQALNFTSMAAPGVDPRTGLYTATLSLGSVTGNYGLGPTLPVVLSYSPLGRQNIGFGLGVSLPVSTYDASSKVLSLSNGETHPVLDAFSSGPVTVDQQKLITFKMSKSSQHYAIVYKNGNSEYLTGPDNAQRVKVPFRLQNAAGHQLLLEWEFWRNTPRLKTVRDDSGAVLLSVTYPDDNASLRFWPGTRDEYTVSLTLDNKRLVAVQNHAVPEFPLDWKLGYSDVGGGWGLWLTSLEGPGGLLEYVRYRTDGGANKFPLSARLPALPYVQRFTVRATKDSAEQHTDYAYAIHNSNNFLGYNSGQNWESTKDSLYGPMTNYSYSSTETFSRDSKTISTTRTYNCYHQLTEQKDECEGHTHILSTVYHARPGQAFDAQPAFFLLPKTRTESWISPEGLRRDDVTQTSFDQYGNPLQQRNPDGSGSTWVYYGKLGHGGDCPAEPNGFVRFLRQQTDSPATEDVAFYADASDRITRFTWENIGANQSVSVIVKNEQSHYAGSRLLTQTRYSYDASTALCGSLTSKAVTTFHQGQPAGTTEETFSISPSEHTLSYDHSFTSYDKLRLNETREYSRWSHRLLSQCDAQGKKSMTTWDKLGRQLAITHNAGTVYETTAHMAYGISSQPRASFYVQHTDAVQNIERVHVSALGHPTAQEYCLADAPSEFKLRSQFSYDGFNWLKESVEHDYQINGETRTATLTKTHEYDAWGQVCRTVGSDGIVEVVEYNPVTREEVRYQTDIGNTLTSARLITRQNRAQQPLSIEHADVEGRRMSFKSFAYDGWNHLRGETESATETESHTTSFALDDFGRATQTTLSDGSIVSREYADFSPEPLLTRICVNGVTAGTQTFDGLGRCVESVSGGRKHRFKYQDAASGQPVEVIGPDNRSIVFTRIPELNDAIKETRVGSIRQQFNYHPLTGAMAAATVGDCCTENSFYESGRLKETKEYRNGQLTQQARYFYSSGGTLYRQTDVLRGIDKTFSRDSLGRITGIDDNDLHTRLSYDALGRLKQLRTEIGADGRICTTDITWDALGRETARHMELPSLSVTQTSTWQLDDLLASRKSVSSTGGESFETFSYDNRSRLVRYANEAENSLLPQDEYGRPFRGQTFAYDVWSNVTMVGTDYLGSPSESIAVYAFNNPSDPCQLTGISYSHTDPDQLNRDGSIRYDAAGRVIQDDRGRLFTWDDAGRLAGATDGNSCGDYAYDALNRMIQLPNEAGVPQYREYLGGVLAAIRDAGNDTRIARAGGQCVALVHNRAGCEIELLGCDRNGSVITAGKKASARCYTPYGVMNGGSSNRQSPGGMPLGFNGEGVDAMTGLYHLGNGYRPYSPVLMRFMAPDSFSPFGAGGINPYAYCSGDPINHTDPSGHIGFWKLFGYIGLAIAGVALAVTGVGAIASSVIAGAVTISVAEAVVMAADAVSLGTGIASEVVHGTTAKKWLGIASLVTGLVGVGYGAVKSAPKLIKGAKGLFKEAGELLPEGSMPRAKFKNGSPYKKGGPEHPVKVRVAGKNTITRKYDPKIYRQEAANSFKAYDNGHGSRVWLTKYETNSHIVRSKMEDIILRSEQPPANVFVLSGTHGEDLGSRLEQPDLFAVREFLEEDTHSASAVYQQGGRSNITVVNVPVRDQAELTEILHAENSVVIGAFCHSRNDRLITDALNLRPKTSWIPDHRFGPNHASW